MTSERMQAQRQEEIRKRLEYRRLRRLTNQSLRCALECPHPKRTIATCMGCKRPECVAAKKALDSYWAEVDAR